MSRYLDVPEWDTPEQDAERDAQAWVAKRAWEVFEVATELAEAFSVMPSYWRPADALDVEEILSELVKLRKRAEAAGFLAADGDRT